MSMAIHVSELQFDDENLSEVERHGVSMMQVQSVLEGEPRFFPNRKSRAATHLMIGPDNGGQMLSVPIIETPVKGIWRPVTAWPSTTAQRAKWRQAK